MDAGAVLEVMRKFFGDKQPPEVLAALAEQSPRALLKESLDILDFLVYLEEELGQEIDTTQAGQVAMKSQNFGELAEQVSQLLAEG